MQRNVEESTHHTDATQATEGYSIHRTRLILIKSKAPATGAGPKDPDKILPMFFFAPLLNTDALNSSASELSIT